jgi:23S rRNA-intervening sequence protein
MMDYEKLDAWKACHALALAVYEATHGKSKRDPQLIGAMRRNSLLAASKLAFGCGTRHRKLFLLATHRATGYLSTFAYDLSLCRVMTVLPHDVCTRLDALRGRASFYAGQLLESLLTR